ncbi:hypothetical protein Q8W71_00310 [Methylobacterium sp. NEAU 140]|uniref:hypothetical protein n=1 Tax=Methylobacterium sp. NEAU 140 TaxID=3064945 RepID=UPI002736280B|nr:hypothetical protein [Methylobacterium sp. NEAU 140]MDP4021051.1 hypothetical protein [Methylobacterium sp. NEAU 140]
MFESEIRIEVERRLQKACDDRARNGLPPPVSVDALRAVTRSDLLRELEAARIASKAATAMAAPVTPKPAPKPTPARVKPQTAPKPSATALLMELMDRAGPVEPVFPSLRNTPTKPAQVVDQDEVAAQAILAAARLARGG